MKKFFSLAIAIGLALYAGATNPLLNNDGDISRIQPTLSFQENPDFFSCTVTRTTTYTLNEVDCNGFPMSITTTGTATATASTCQEANASALLSAGYNAYSQAYHFFLFETGDCQGPPQP